jgi:glycosyltransferase involved in cell wall biosynthesis
MSAPIAYDTVRLLLGSMAVTPRGIDRVDLQYARFFFETWPGDCGGTLPTPWGVRWYDRKRVIRGLDRLEELWGETIQPDEDPVLLQIKKRLAGTLEPPTEKSRKSSRSHIRSISRFLRVVSLTDFSVGAAVVRSVPEHSIYVNVAQVGLAMPRIVSWLPHRPDVKSVFMLHDAIPLEHQELVSAKESRRHEMIVDRTASFASGLIVSTAAAREAIVKALRSRGRASIPIVTVPLPVAPVFLQNAEPDRDLRGHDYFVACGAIEPRKNHLLLLNVWRELVRERGERAPRLVVVGSCGRDAGPVLCALEQCRPLHGSVILAHGLSSPALRQLIAHAKALLMPSFAEGFGLPVIEAFAVGTPVIASDLPAHREIADDLAVYRHPTDAAGWLADICMFADGSGIAAEMRRRVAAYRPTTWGEYFRQIERFLENFEQS